jgi:choline-sulfatase
MLSRFVLSPLLLLICCNSGAAQPSTPVILISIETLRADRLGCYQPGRASVLDIAPTILDAIGLARPNQMQGRSLIESRSVEEIYSESLYPQNHFGCAALHTVRVGHYKYIDAPQPEFYDLSSNPAELKNLYERQKSKALALRERLVALRSNFQTSRSSPAQSPAPETVNALRSLGYLSESTSSSRLEFRVDPKERIADSEQFGRASALASAGEITESNHLLEQLSHKLPEIVAKRVSLGLNQQRLGQFAEAADDFKLALERDPLNARAHFDLGISYFRLSPARERRQRAKGCVGH